MGNRMESNAKELLYELNILQHMSIAHTMSPGVHACKTVYTCVHIPLHVIYMLTHLLPKSSRTWSQKVALQIKPKIPTAPGNQHRPTAYKGLCSVILMIRSR